MDQGLYQFLGFEYALVGIIYQGFQFNPLPYHTLSLGLVIGNAGLLCFLARSLGFEP